MNRERWAMVVFLMLAFAMRMWRLGCDPPPADLARDEAPWTDEGTIAHPVISTLASDADCSTLAFRGGRSLHQVLLCVVFRSLGTHKILGRWLTVLFGIVSTAMLARMGSVVWPRLGGPLACGLSAIGFFYVIFDRTMLTEGILLAALSCCAWFGMRSKRGIHAALAGCLVGLLVVGLKYHAIALAFALFLYFQLRRRCLALPLLAGVVVSIVVWRAYLVPDASVSQVLGVPSRISHPTMGLVAPSRLVPSIWYAGTDARFFIYQIPLFLFASFEIMALLARPVRWLTDVSSPVLVAFLWFLVTFVGVGLFQYGPSRYYHLASSPFMLLSVAGMRRLWEAKGIPLVPKGRRLVIMLLYGVWLQMQMFPPLAVLRGWPGWLPLLGTPLTLFLYWLLGRPPEKWGGAQRIGRLVLVSLLALQCLVQGALYYVGVVRSEPDLSRISKLLAAELPEDAVVVGRVAGTLAISGGFDSLPLLSQVTLSHMASIGEGRSAFLVTLEGEEDGAEPALWSHLTRQDDFPVNYKGDVDTLSIWRFDP